MFRIGNILKLLFGRLNFPVLIGRNLEIGSYIHEKEYHKEDLRILLEECGFVDILIKSRNFGLIGPQLFHDFSDQNSVFSKYGHIIFCSAVKP